MASSRFVTHEPVLLEPVLAALRPEEGGTFVDATLGAGGHAAAILRSHPDTHLIGIDRDADALALAARNLAEFSDRAVFIHSRFSRLAEHVASPVSGIVADLGVSSMQLEQAERGFSFKRPGPLDMRMDPSEGTPLREQLETMEAEELAAILSELGEERRARRIGLAVVRAMRSERGVHDTAALARVVRAASGGRRSGRIDSATRTFQALRMAVNEELEELDALLAVAPLLLRPGGALAIIAFHSLEDRRVKQAFRTLATTEAFALVRRRVLKASEEEKRANPRARSARLRTIRRLS